MKSFIKKIMNTDLGVILRNSINIKPIKIKLFKKKYPITVSDAFLWRTDNKYKTKFKYSDILDLFYKVKNSWIEIHFYSKNNEFIKKKTINQLNLSNEFEIDKSFLDGLEDYGIFYVYHFTDDKESLINSDVISNRCYLGYSQNDNLYSFVHGNTLAKFTGIGEKKSFYTDIVKTSFFKNQTYTIQKNFNSFDKSELFFINPTSKKINFLLENINYKLDPHCSLLLKINNPVVSIKSNCLFFRPTVFSYKGKFIDVHHS